MTEPTIDALGLGQQVVAVLETGLRTATYKLATLMALVDHCVEYLPDNPEDRLAIPIAGRGPGCGRASVRPRANLAPAGAGSFLDVFGAPPGGCTAARHRGAPTWQAKGSFAPLDLSVEHVPWIGGGA